MKKDNGLKVKKPKISLAITFFFSFIIDLKRITISVINNYDYI